MINSAGWHQGDSGLLRRRNALRQQDLDQPRDRAAARPARQAEVDAAARTTQLRKRPRLLGHQLQVREDRRIGLLQQRRRDRARTRSTARGSSPTAGTSSNATTCSGTTTTTSSPARRSTRSPAGSASSAGSTINYPTGRRDHPLRRRQQHRPPEQRVRQLQVGHRLLLGTGRRLRRQRRRRREEHQQPDRRKHDGPRRRRPERRIRLPRNDATGGGNCWARQHAPGRRFAPGNGKVPLDQIYPGCPQAPVLADQVHSLNLTRRHPGDPRRQSNPKTILGYAGQSPPQNQQCIVGAARSRRTRRSKTSRRSRSRRSREKLTCP